MKIKDLISAKSEVVLNLQKSGQFKDIESIREFIIEAIGIDRIADISNKLMYAENSILNKLRAKRGEAIATKLLGMKDIDEQNKII